MTAPKVAAHKGFILRALLLLVVAGGSFYLGRAIPRSSSAPILAPILACEHVWIPTYTFSSESDVEGRNFALVQVRCFLCGEHEWRRHLLVNGQTFDSWRQLHEEPYDYMAGYSISGSNLTPYRYKQWKYPHPCDPEKVAKESR